MKKMKLPTYSHLESSSSIIPTIFQLLLLGFLVQVVQPYTLIGNGDIYTVDDDGEEWVDAVAIDDDGKIVAVGTIDQIYDKMGGTTETEYWDLRGQMMLPGFQDSHLHAVEAGINSELCYIDESADLYDIPFYFEDCPNGGQFGSEGWIVGGGIDISVLAETVQLSDYQSCPHPHRIFMCFVQAKLCSLNRYISGPA